MLIDDSLRIDFKKDHKMYDIECMMLQDNIAWWEQDKQGQIIFNELVNRWDYGKEWLFAETHQQTDLPQVERINQLTKGS